MTTLLLAEHDNATLKEATARALTAAKKLGADVHILVAGQGCRPAAEAAAKLDGVKKVLLADASIYEHMLPEPLALLLQSLAGSYDALVAPSTSCGKNVMPRVAALLDVMQISDLMGVISPDTFERPIFAGNVIETVRSKDAKKVITVRTTAFQASAPGGAAPIEIEGVGDLPTTLARCCAPLRPQPITGYVTLGRGVTVHRSDCASLQRMSALKPERVLKVEWSSAQGGALNVELSVSAYDRRGLLRDLTDVLALERLSIDAVTSRTDHDSGIAYFALSVAVNDLEQFARVLRRLAGVPNVIEARRRL